MYFVKPIHENGRHQANGITNINIDHHDDDDGDKRAWHVRGCNIGVKKRLSICNCMMPIDVVFYGDQ